MEKRTGLKRWISAGLAAVVAITISLGGGAVPAMAVTTEAQETSSFKSTELETSQSWEFSVSGTAITAVLYDDHAEDGMNTLLKLDNDSQVMDWEEFSDGKSTMSIDLSGQADGIYSVTLMSARSASESTVWSLASYNLQIKNGVPKFYFPGGKSEKKFYDGLLDYDPTDYDGLPYYAGQMSHLKEIQTLTKSLTADCGTDEEKVMAIHNWIAKNIAYDYESYLNGNTADAADPDRVFETRHAVCSGYARLARVMFATAGIPCLNIFGYTETGRLLAANTEYNSANHEWNVVYLNGKWHLLDITWDSLNKYYGDEDERNTLDQDGKYTYYGISPVLIGSNHCSLSVYDFSEISGIEVGYLSNNRFYVGDKFSFDGWIVYRTAADATRYALSENYLKFSGYDMSKAGKQTVKVTYGPWSTSYQIDVQSRSSIAKATVFVADATYTGKVLTPYVRVALGSSVLAAGQDYTLSWKNNKNAGTGTVTIKGTGAYTGTVSRTFKISPKSMVPVVTLAKKSFVYSGKVNTPKVTVKLGGKALTASGYQTVYASGRKTPGTYKVTVKLKGNYTGTKAVTFTVRPKGTSLASVTAKKKGFKLKWKKQATQTSGYEIWYATESSFKSGLKKVRVSNAKTVSKTISGLKAKKVYYVKVRTFKKVSGKYYNSAWSGVKKVKTK